MSLAHFSQNSRKAFLEYTLRGLPFLWDSRVYVTLSFSPVPSITKHGRMLRLCLWTHERWARYQPLLSPGLNKEGSLLPSFFSTWCSSNVHMIKLE